MVKYKLDDRQTQLCTVAAHRLTAVSRVRLGTSWKAGLLLSLVAFVIVSTLLLGHMETKQFSAYAACRKVALETKGYAVWGHEQTVQQLFISWVVFSDGFNDLSCQAIGVGPFWKVRKSMHTLVGCGKSPDNKKLIMKSTCAEDYFGVSP